MGLDMYLIKAKRIKGFDFSRVVELRNIADAVHIYHAYIKAIKLIGIKPLKEIAEELNLTVFYNETEEEFFSRLLTNMNDKELLQNVKEYHNLSEEEKEIANKKDLIELEQVGYWRKANQIHHWFVENVQNGVDDCNPYEVSKEQLENLKFTCIRVLESLDDGDESLAEELLPTQSGFFFGSTDYGDLYYKALEHTIEIIDEALKETDFEYSTLIYQSSW